MIVQGERGALECEHPLDVVERLCAAPFDLGLDHGVDVVHKRGALVLSEVPADHSLELDEGRLVNGGEALLTVLVPVEEASLDEGDLGGEGDVVGKLSSERPV